MMSAFPFRRHRAAPSDERSDGVAISAAGRDPERIIADWIQRTGLATPALLWLDSTRPLCFLGGQTLRLGEPLWGLFASTNTLLEAAAILEDRDRFDRLLGFLDAPATREPR